MKKLFGLALVPVLLAAFPLVASAEHHVEKRNMDMEKSHKQQMMPQQQGVNTAFTTRVSVVDPKLNAHWVKGQWNLVTLHYPEAIDSFENVLSLDPDNVHALNGLSIALYQQGRFDEALRYINRATDLDPVNGRLFLTKAQILDAKNMPKEAAEAYLTFTSLNPEDGYALTAQRRADELFRQVEPQLNEGWRNYLLGLHRLSLYQPQEAITYFERFKAAEPNNPQAHILLGRAYLELGQPNQAIPLFEAAIRANSQNPVAYYQLGTGYDMSGQTKMATDAWKKFLQFAPKSEKAMFINRHFEVRSNTTR